MKILFFIDSLMAGGKERRFVELLKGLKSFSSIDYQIVLMNEDVHYTDVLLLNKNIHSVIRKSKKDLSIFFKFYKICKSFQPEIVHCFDSMTAIYLIPICKLLKIKMVNGLISDAPEKLNIFHKAWLRGKLSFPFSNVIIGNSNAGLTAYNAPKDKSFVIHNGFDFKRTDNLVHQEKIRYELKIKTKYIIGMVASFSPNKDYRTYFMAAEIVLNQRDDVTFVAIGKATDSEEAKKLINKKNQGFIKAIGKKTNIESYISAMDICVLSTFTEGISNSIMEYMAMRKPVIATSGGGSNEIVENNKTGFLINPANPNELAERIQILLNDFDLRHKMGESGYERVRKYFSLDSMVLKYVACYQNLSLSARN